MGVYIAGFLCALVLAGIVVAWIIYCMFIRERHKSEKHQYTISDLEHKNRLLATNLTTEEDVEKEIRAGILILPTHHKHKDEEYGMRPDYPESAAPLSPSKEKLLDVFNDAEEDYYKDGIYEVDMCATPFPCLNDLVV